QAYRDAFTALQRRNPDAAARIDRRALLQGMFDRESKVAGALAILFSRQHYEILRSLLFPSDYKMPVEEAAGALGLIDPLEDFDPRTELDRVSLSPLGVVHLFRQYFFEFATFLGPPVEHL